MSSRLLSEAVRLQALDASQLKVEPAEVIFSRLVCFAAESFGTAIAIISIIDDRQQIYFAKVGTERHGTTIEEAFCATTVSNDAPLVVLDATRDPLWRHHAMVSGGLQVGFYAGIPIHFRGQPIGSFCIIDRKPREAFPPDDMVRLKRYAIIAEELIELRALRAEKKAEATRFERMAATTPDAMIVAGADGHILSWNPSAERMFGYTAEEAAGLDVMALMPERMRGLFRPAMDRYAGTTREIVAQGRDGRAIAVEFSLSRWSEGGVPLYGMVLRDISDRKALEERLHHLAHKDALTGLPNRTVFIERLTAALANGGCATVLLVDLDGFKDVNDKLGHGAGDEVLGCAAARIRDCLDTDHMVARLGGDEFAVLLPGSADAAQAGRIAERIIERIAAPFDVQDSTMHLGVSLGIAIGPHHGEQPDELLSAADLALYRAKSDGRHCFRLYTPGLRCAAVAQRRFSQEIRRAVDAREFVLFYQPQVRLADGALLGAEALIRWQHPDHGLMAPAEFLSTVTGSRYARDVADWLLEDATAQAVRWRRMGAADFRVAVNLCRSQLRAPGLSRSVLDTLARTGLPACGLELELTEDLTLGREEHDVASLRDLHAAGVGLALDDYGTGFASLSILKNYPLTRLKIDRSFVREMVDVSDVTIIRAIISLAKGFGLEVTAEGIETENQLARLHRKGCGSGQGYLFSKPLPAAQFEARFIRPLSGALLAAE